MARLQTKKAGGSDHRCAETSGIPCAMVLRLIRDLPGVPGLLASVALYIAYKGLTPASGDQDHTTSPSARTSRASRHLSVHHIPTQRPWRRAYAPLGRS